ncbi:hypothetical protein GTN31_07235 [Macrococcoides canis]|uniref:Hint domain-containing protein n=1 Tax=Macrococcoides canis TaxID=1855823 RepID=UPI0013E91ECD|nr:Hint domain-containing protein [Macrococcus canis]QIH76152.1 hypothetical protein GTN31_07235 [Macrococcus canis]
MNSIEKTGMKASTKVITQGLKNNLKMPKHLINLKTNFKSQMDKAHVQGLVDKISGSKMVEKSSNWLSKSNNYVKNAVNNTFEKSFGLDSLIKPKLSGDHVLNQIVKNTNIQRLPSVLSQKVIPYRVVKDRVMRDISHVKKTIARPVEQFRKHYEPAFNQFIDNVSSGTKRAFNNLEYTKLVGEHLHVKMFDKPVFRLTREELGIILRSRMTDVKARLCEFNLIKNCFVAGTLVQTKIGLKPIEEVQVGDEVLSRCMETGRVTYKKVTDTFHKQTDVITTITLLSGETITSSPQHLYFTTNRGFIVAEALTDGDTLLCQNQLIRIRKIETKVMATEVYNFEVEDYHTYFVGNVRALVHNDCTDAEMRFNFGRYLRAEIGGPQKWIYRPHAHHILYKMGKGKVQKELVNIGQKILREYDIDPIFGLENLVWAPNVKGLHSEDNLRLLVDDLVSAYELRSDREDIVQILKEHGRRATYWGR